jgi:hypothetical protein
MSAQVYYMIAQQRRAARQHAGHQARLAGKAHAGRRTAIGRVTRAPQHRQPPWVVRFTLHGHHIAKLDRFVGQAQRAALRAEREFEGVNITVDAQGIVSVHAIDMTSMLL